MKNLDLPNSCNNVTLQFLDIKTLSVYAISSDLFTEITLNSKKEYYPYLYMTKTNEDYFLHIDFSKITEGLEVVIESENDIVLSILDYISNEAIIVFNSNPPTINGCTNKIILTLSKINSSKSIRIE